MEQPEKPRLRYFANSPGQRHIAAADHYLYRAPEPRYRFNVIGTGTIGQEHMRVAALHGLARIHGVFDTQALSGDVAIEQYRALTGQAPRRHESLKSACNDPEADALIVATPNFTHLDVVRAAAAAGKPILLEKPMATTLPDAVEIARLARAAGAPVQVGLQYRYKAMYAEARAEALARRALGRLVTINLLEHRPPFLDKVGQWNKFQAHSGGTLIEKCCHYFDLMNLFAEGRPGRVYASGGQAVNFRDFEVDGRRADIADHAHVIVDYDNGVRANLSLAMFCPEFTEEVVLCGDKGRLHGREVFDFQREPRSRTTLTVSHGENAATRNMQLAYPDAIERSGHHGATYFEQLAFVDRLDGKETDAATLAEGFWSIAVGAAAEQSLQTARPVGIDELLADLGLDTADIDPN
ncbi:MAG: Gfo/Idh/MocA family oxidoreductase [Pseudomonadota bacterium]